MDVSVRQSLFAPRFLTRLRATGLEDENPRVERVLAISRVLIGGSVLLMDLRHPLTAEPYNQLLILMMLIYCVQSMGLVIWMLMNPEPSSGPVLFMQISDVFWPVVLSLFANPPSPLVFVFFLFALMTTAFRYGMYETMIAALGCCVVLVIQEVLVWRGPASVSHVIYTNPDASRLALRCGFLLMAGFLLGYLSEREKEQRAEIGVTNYLLSRARVGNRLSDVVTDISAELAKVYGAKRVYAAVAQNTSGRLFRWEITLSPQRRYDVRELPSTEYDREILAGFPHTFYIAKQRDGKVVMDAIDDEGRHLATLDPSNFAMPDATAQSLVVVSVEIGREWTGRFVMADGRLGWNRDRELRFAQTVWRQIAPALYSIYLFRRLRSRAGAMERARVARELHDTAIQSLISIEMQVDVLRRTSNGRTAASELDRIQKLLREEVLNLRELMQSMRPVEVGPNQFLDFMAQLVERFRSDTGIDARFVSELEEVSLPASACRELVRVVQEGLVNVRKHSGAKSVYVRFGAQSGLWRLVIDDDGKGFPFTGRLTLGELDGLHRGPAVIKERVRAIGGDMLIESSPGHGSRLEITVPQKGYEFYG